MNRKLLLLVCVLMLAAGGATAQVAEPNRDSLLAAWEALQRDDPQTLQFEKIEDGRYRYQTERFPFDGTVRVLNLVIDDRMLDYGAGGVMGVVEVDLEEVSDEFRRQYAYSIGLWHGANTLYFDGETGEWVTANDWQSSMVDQYSDVSWYARYSDYLWLLLLAIMVLLVLWLSRRAARQLKIATAAQDKALAEQERAIRLTEEAIEISRDSNRVLKEIRDLLKDGGN
jgi:hypothetical protein